MLLSASLARLPKMLPLSLMTAGTMLNNLLAVVPELRTFAQLELQVGAGRELVTL